MDVRFNFHQRFFTGLVIWSLILMGCSVFGLSIGSPPEWVRGIESLCIQVEQSYPTIPWDFSQPVGEELQGVFERSGVKSTLGARGDCQATLAIQLEITPIQKDVLGAGKCYIDAEASGEAVLTAPGNGKLKMALSVPASTSGGFKMVYDCPKFASDGPVDLAWARAVSPMLAKWWGGPALVAMLGSEQGVVRWRGIQELKEMGLESSGALPSLIELLGDANPTTRAVAASALGGFGTEAAEAVPALVKAADDADTQVGLAAIKALGAIGPDARTAVPKLIEKLASVDIFQYETVQALKKITGEDFGEDAKAWQQWQQAQP